MSLVAPSLEDVLETVPEQVRREADERSRASGADRRVHRRHPASDVSWLRTLRLKQGPEVKLVDISAGGALIDTRVQLKPGSEVTLQLTSGGQVVELLSEVIRCRLEAIDGSRALYRGACEFDRPIALDALAQAPVAAAPTLVAAADTAWQKIVVRYREGAMLKGYTLDFHPSRSHLSLWPSVRAHVSERVIVPLTRLKALFFVKDFAGNPSHRENNRTAPNAGAGRKIEVTFCDREVIRGSTLNYRPEGIGFFVTPADASGNNQRVFVINGAIRQVRFP
jgi:hypothetical protein